MSYVPVIGLEIHVQLNTKSKLFCSCPNSFGQVPNENTCVVCQAYPGTLPVLNKEAYHKALKTALALECHINHSTLFDRKHYFYPDLPKGYQITQFYHPFCHGGKIDIQLDENEIKSIHLDHIHMEEDAGKLVHDSGNVSYLDLNRAGVPLIEIVTRPDMNSIMEVNQFLVRLRKILRYLDVSSCDMEKGAFRCDVNVSIKKKSATQLGSKVEIKNLNSFRHIRKALEYEIKRQTQQLETSGSVESETRLYDLDNDQTASMRSKYAPEDYYYFPEHDLPKYTVSNEELDALRKTLPELPQQKELRWMQEYKLSEDDIVTLSETPQLASYFEETVEAYPKNPKKIANWIKTELLKMSYEDEENGSFCFPITSKNLASLISKIDSGEVSGKMAKSIFEKMCQSKLNVDESIKALGIKLIDDDAQIEEFVKQVFNANPDVVESYHKGKVTVIGFLVGQVMALSKGQASPDKVNKIIVKLLSS